MQKPYGVPGALDVLHAVLLELYFSLEVEDENNDSTGVLFFPSSGQE